MRGHRRYSSIFGGAFEGAFGNAALGVRRCGGAAAMPGVSFRWWWCLVLREVSGGFQRAPRAPGTTRKVGSSLQP